MANKNWAGRATDHFTLAVEDADGYERYLILQPIAAAYQRAWTCVMRRGIPAVGKARRGTIHATSVDEAKRKAEELARSWGARLPREKRR